METTLTAEDLQNLNPEELINKLLEENKAKVELAEKIKNVEKGAVEAATKLNQTKKEKEALELEANQLKEQRSPEKVTTIVEQTLAKKEAQQKVEAIANQLPDDVKKQFIDQYKEIVGDKAIAVADVDKYIKASLSIVAPDIQKPEAASLAIGGGQAGAEGSVKSKKLEDAQARGEAFFGKKF